MNDINIPARYLTPGDTVWGFTVSTQTNFPDGTREFKFVVPYTTHYMTVVLREQDLDAVSFPVSKRGDEYSPNARNALLGLPPVPEPVYVAPKPVAIYPVGTRVGDIKHFDRSMHVQFECPEHHIRYSSKDPFVSHWFAVGPDQAWCPEGCQVPKNDFTVSVDYLPTRNG